MRVIRHNGGDAIAALLMKHPTHVSILEAGAGIVRRGAVHAGTAKC